VIELWNIEFTSNRETYAMVSSLNNALLTSESFIMIYNVLNFLTPTWFVVVIRIFYYF